MYAAIQIYLFSIIIAQSMANYNNGGGSPADMNNNSSNKSTPDSIGRHWSLTGSSVQDSIMPTSQDNFTSSPNPIPTFSMHLTTTIQEISPWDGDNPFLNSSHNTKILRIHDILLKNLANLTIHNNQTQQQQRIPNENWINNDASSVDSPLIFAQTRTNATSVPPSQLNTSHDSRDLMSPTTTFISSIDTSTKSAPAMTSEFGFNNTLGPIVYGTQAPIFDQTSSTIGNAFATNLSVTSAEYRTENLVSVLGGTNSSMVPEPISAMAHENVSTMVPGIVSTMVPVNVSTMIPEIIFTMVPEYISTMVPENISMTVPGTIWSTTGTSPNGSYSRIMAETTMFQVGNTNNTISAMDHTQLPDLMASDSSRSLDVKILRNHSIEPIPKEMLQEVLASHGYQQPETFAMPDDFRVGMNGTKYDSNSNLSLQVPTTTTTTLSLGQNLTMTIPVTSGSSIKLVTQTAEGMDTLMNNVTRIRGYVTATVMDTTHLLSSDEILDSANETTNPSISLGYLEMNNSSASSTVQSIRAIVTEPLVVSIENDSMGHPVKSLPLNSDTLRLMTQLLESLDHANSTAKILPPVLNVNPFSEEFRNNMTLTSSQHPELPYIYYNVTSLSLPQTSTYQSTLPAIGNSQNTDSSLLPQPILEYPTMTNTTDLIQSSISNPSTNQPQMPTTETASTSSIKEIMADPGLAYLNVSSQNAIPSSRVAIVMSPASDNGSDVSSTKSEGSSSQTTPTATLWMRANGSDMMGVSEIAVTHVTNRSIVTAVLGPGWMNFTGAVSFDLITNTTPESGIGTNPSPTTTFITIPSTTGSPNPNPLSTNYTGVGNGVGTGNTTWKSIMDYDKSTSTHIIQPEQIILNASGLGITETIAIRDLQPVLMKGLDLFNTSSNQILKNEPDDLQTAAQMEYEDVGNNNIPQPSNQTYDDGESMKLSTIQGPLIINPHTDLSAIMTEFLGSPEPMSSVPTPPPFVPKLVDDFDSETRTQLYNNDRSNDLTALMIASLQNNDSDHNLNQIFNHPELISSDTLSTRPLDSTAQLNYTYFPTIKTADIESQNNSTIGTNSLNVGGGMISMSTPQPDLVTRIQQFLSENTVYQQESTPKPDLEYVYNLKETTINHADGSTTFNLAIANNTQDLSSMMFHFLDTGTESTHPLILANTTLNSVTNSNSFQQNMSQTSQIMFSENISDDSVPITNLVLPQTPAVLVDDNRFMETTDSNLRVEQNSDQSVQVGPQYSVGHQNDSNSIPPLDYDYNDRNVLNQSIVIYPYQPTMHPSTSIILTAGLEAATNAGIEDLSRNNMQSFNRMSDNSTTVDGRDDRFSGNVQEITLTTDKFNKLISGIGNETTTTPTHDVFLALNPGARDNGEASTQTTMMTTTPKNSVVQDIVANLEMPPDGNGQDEPYVFDRNQTLLHGGRDDGDGSNYFKDLKDPEESNAQDYGIVTLPAEGSKMVITNGSGTTNYNLQPILVENSTIEQIYPVRPIVTETKTSPQTTYVTNEHRTADLDVEDTFILRFNDSCQFSNLNSRDKVAALQSIKLSVQSGLGLPSDGPISLVECTPVMKLKIVAAHLDEASGRSQIRNGRLQIPVPWSRATQGSISAVELMSIKNIQRIIAGEDNQEGQKEISAKGTFAHAPSSPAIIVIIMVVLVSFLIAIMIAVTFYHCVKRKRGSKDFQAHQLNHHGGSFVMEERHNGNGGVGNYRPSGPSHMIPPPYARSDMIDMKKLAHPRLDNVQETVPYYLKNTNNNNNNCNNSGNNMGKSSFGGSIKSFGARMPLGAFSPGYVKKTATVAPSVCMTAITPNVDDDKNRGLSKEGEALLAAGLEAISNSETTSGNGSTSAASSQVGSYHSRSVPATVAVGDHDSSSPSRSQKVDRSHTILDPNYNSILLDEQALPDSYGESRGMKSNILIDSSPVVPRNGIEDRRETLTKRLASNVCPDPEIVIKG